MTTNSSEIMQARKDCDDFKILKEKFYQFGILYPAKYLSNREVK